MDLPDAFVSPLAHEFFWTTLDYNFCTNCTRVQKVELLLLSCMSTSQMAPFSSVQRLFKIYAVYCTS